MNNKELLKVAVQAADGKNAQNLMALDMKGISILADYFIIGHGGSVKQVQAIANEVKSMAEKAGAEVKRMEGYQEGRWVLVDLGDVVAHIFHEEDRLYYNIEKLWGEADQVEISQMLA
ncbi:MULTISPECIES: ribosome silencing factor [Geomicrobium]|uniref:Ribosomal silencing factor RsfS n=1 Tax=Geomicrobium sediminis TaxID=1347788 RepID=A0ABS2PED1_9BACL|nr:MULTISPECIES: ribosome silencing factor [Geomicrobium]MBM7633784.1 ribosome-associated protein [Geomicrobium sediminis]GAJ99077.1 Iojap protein [Geomicrobium sp. JCM 19055]GAK06408.1 Iojap protein [Geomicrobium sp. JCM 19038]